MLDKSQLQKKRERKAAKRRLFRAKRYRFLRLLGASIIGEQAYQKWRKRYHHRNDFAKQKPRIEPGESRPHV